MSTWLINSRINSTGVAITRTWHVFFQKKNQNALFHYCNLVYLYQINVYFYF